MAYVYRHPASRHVLGRCYSNHCRNGGVADRTVDTIWNGRALHCIACGLLTPVLVIIRLLLQGVILKRTTYIGIPVYLHTLSPIKKDAA